MADQSIESTYPLTFVSIGQTVMGDIGDQSPSVPPVSAATLASLSANLYDLTTTDSKLGLYDVYGIRTEWLQDVTKLAIPIGAGPTTTGGEGCRVAVLGSPYGYKVVHWIVIRKKFAPVLPAIEESQYCQLLTSTVGALNDCLETDNITTVYSREGTYTYVLTKPIRPGTDTMSTPWSLPVFQAPSDDIEAGDFKSGMAEVDPEDE